MATLHDVRFPRESPEYRAARDELLRAEIELRRQQEKVAAQRRKLPLGGAIAQDYVFEEATGSGTHKIKLSELFAPKKDSLLLYSFMFGPEMEHACPSCTSMLDGLEGQVSHATQRINLAVVAKSPLARIQAFAKERGWRRHRLLSSAENTYNRDYHGETAKAEQIPSLNVFVRRGNQIHHFYNTELLFAPKEPGMDHRHVDMIWPLWHLFDQTPEGRGNDFYPALQYK